MLKKINYSDTHSVIMRLNGEFHLMLRDNVQEWNSDFYDNAIQVIGLEKWNKIKSKYKRKYNLSLSLDKAMYRFFYELQNESQYVGLIEMAEEVIRTFLKAQWITKFDIVDETPYDWEVAGKWDFKHWCNRLWERIHIENLMVSYGFWPFDKTKYDYYHINWTRPYYVFAPELDTDYWLNEVGELRWRRNLMDFDWIRWTEINRDFINTYSHKPNPKFFTLSQDSITFWIELEFNDCLNQETIKAYKECDDFFYAKEDGSLEEWIEFVSHPFDVERYLQNNHKIYNLISEVKWVTNLNTWLHVHIGRKNMSEKQIENIVYLVNRNIQEWSILSWRYNRRRAWATKEDCEYKLTRIIVWDKYKAVNIAPENTIEIRTFQNSNDPAIVLWRIELTMALAYYCKKWWQWGDFMKYCQYLIRKYDFKYLWILLQELKNDKCFESDFWAKFNTLQDALDNGCNAVEVSDWIVEVVSEPVLDTFPNTHTSRQTDACYQYWVGWTEITMPVFPPFLQF